MKFVLVTSQITYVPRNSLPFFEKILEKKSAKISGVIIIQNLSLKIFLTIVRLYITGCYRLALTLTKNIFSLPFKERDHLFDQHHVPIIKVKSVNDAQFIDWVKKNEVDVVINFRSRGIVKNKALSAPRLGWINLHHGILPTYRGLFCDLYALYENRPAGFSVHKMEEGIDSGNIYSTKVVSKPGEKNYPIYLARLANYEAIEVIDIISQIENTAALPLGDPNDAEKVEITKTPTEKELREMQRKGMQL